jgi:hypothetical protein
VTLNWTESGQMISYRIYEEIDGVPQHLLSLIGDTAEREAAERAEAYERSKRGDGVYLPYYGIFLERER